MTKCLYLIDGSAFIFRAYHALPPLSRSDGTPVGAVSGFCNMLFKLREDIKYSQDPTHIGVIFDAGSVTFRNDIYAEYKSHRPPPPDDLIPQFSLCRQAAEAFGMTAVEKEGYEADDIIATYAVAAANEGLQVRILSSDKDLMQLVNSSVMMYDPMKSKSIGREQVFDKFGVYPELVTHVQALAGDSSDNIPGVPGIGIKTAAQLINDFGDLETLLKNADTIKQKKRRENLIEFADKARISFDLVTLKQDVPELLALDDLSLQDMDSKNCLTFLQNMELRTLTKRVMARLGENELPIAINTPAQGDLFANNPQSKPKQKSYKAITNIKELENFLETVRHKAIVSFDTETTGLHIISDKLVGICLSHTIGEGVYIPLSHKEGDQIPIDKALEVIKPILEDDAILKIGHNIKYDASIMAQHNIKVTPYDDTMLLSSTLYGGKHRHNMDELSRLYLDHTPVSYEDICGKGKNQISFDQVPIEKATNYAAEDADITLKLWHKFKPEVIKAKKLNFYEVIERKIPEIVSKMEINGILPDKSSLQELSDRFSAEMDDLAGNIYRLSGEEFNIASPKQMGEILFEKLNIPHPAKKKKTATGQMATGSDILEKIASEGYEIADLILRWRSLQKLKSTYADSLIEHIVQETSRIHTSFHLAGAATGRFSSSDPNLQNIPIKTEEGRLIRKTLIASEGNVLLSADYSQIELRLLAKVANVPMLSEAFNSGDDIHAKTASEVFNIELNKVDSDLRRKAKAVNFGIIYGISSFGLSRQLDITKSEAQQYIDIYFERFPQIKEYMESTKQEAREKGYVETIFGRRIHINNINTRNFIQRSMAERTAINAPIQGAAADIIKCAMIHADKLISEKYPDIKMLLQIHDELVFEVPKGKCNNFADDIKKTMEQAPNKSFPNIETTPVIVETGHGKNWDDAH